MPVTALDPVTALVVIDLQRGLQNAPTVHPMTEMVTRANTLIAAFRRRGLPIVLVSADGTPPGRTEEPSRHGGSLPDGFADLIDELDHQSGDHVIRKQARSAFTHTGLLEQLRVCGVTQLVVCGVATSGGVESTARDGHELGFNVTVAVDASTDVRPEAERHSLEYVLPRIAETGSTEQIVALLGAGRE